MRLRCLSQHGGCAELSKNLNASSFKKDLSSDTTFSQIHLCWTVPLFIRYHCYRSSLSRLLKASEKNLCTIAIFTLGSSVPDQ
jgi:hypothetical protein